jgi:hypothetical protein
MVEVEFNIEAKEDTIQYSQAANANLSNLQARNVTATDMFHLVRPNSQ